MTFDKYGNCEACSQEGCMDPRAHEERGFERGLERGRIAGLTGANISDTSKYVVVARAKLEALRENIINADADGEESERDLWLALTALDELLKPGRADK